MPEVFFATPEHCLSPLSGGQQLYTREILETLSLAGFRVTAIGLPFEQNWRARVHRQLLGRPYHCPYSMDSIGNLCQQAMASNARLLLLNGVSFLECVQQIREQLPTTKLVLVSHGLDSTDYVHELNAKMQREPASEARNSELRRLGRQLVTECQRLAEYDAVLGLSQTEAEINRWLGARNSLWLPRSVCSSPIHWNPQKGRVGFVGTLDHPPNLEGLRRVLELVAQRGSSVTIRIVGRPEKVGNHLARHYRCAEYLGALCDEELAHEAGSWRAFLHPVFCVARGASTKLATGLGWGIPIVATTAGRRGYQWASGDLIESNTPAEFVEQMIRLAEDDSYMNRIRQQVLQVACSSPTLEQNASVLRSCLEQLLLETA